MQEFVNLQRSDIPYNSGNQLFNYSSFITIKQISFLGRFKSSSSRWKHEMTETQTQNFRTRSSYRRSHKQNATVV